MARELDPETMARMVMMREALRMAGGPDTVAPRRHADVYAAANQASGLRAGIPPVTGGNANIAVLPPDAPDDSTAQIIAALGAAGTNVIEGLGTRKRRAAAKERSDKLDAVVAMLMGGGGGGGMVQGGFGGGGGGGPPPNTVNTGGMPAGPSQGAGEDWKRHQRY